MTGSLSGTDIIQIILVLLFSVTIHEFMHGYVAHLLGDTTAKDQGRLSLNPVKHIDPFMTVVLPAIMILLRQPPIMAAKPVPINFAKLKLREYGMALVALAGPLSNFVLACIFNIILNNFNGNSFISGLLVWAVEINVFLFIFNLIPIPPLDGSRVLYAFAPESIQEFMQKIEPFGLFIIFGLVLTGFLNSLLINLYNAIISILP